MSADKKIGLFSGFEEYVSPSKQDYIDVMTRGMVVPDANVLLDLYRYRDQTRGELLDALARVPSLWVPHQVLDGFWRNRIATIRVSRQTVEATVEQLRSRRSDLEAAINEWANACGADSSTRDELKEIIESAVGKVAARLGEIWGSEASDVPESTSEDPIVRALSTILEGKIGDPFPIDRLQLERNEAQRRIEKRIPPGFADKAKSETPFDDYFVWAQILDEAQSRNCSVLFITRDQKEDWWKTSGKERLGPRGELIRELASRTGGGGRLLFSTPRQFLGWARDLLGVSVSKNSIDDIERIEGLGIGDWSQEELSLFDQLLDEADTRTTIEQLPEGSNSDTYADILLRLCELLRENELSFVDYISEFQRIFPRISLRSEAKRRASCLMKLGLAERASDRVSLTPLGVSFIEDQDVALIQTLFLQRIRGARELFDLSANSGGIAMIRRKLKKETPQGLTQNQAILILRWLEQLKLA